MRVSANAMLTLAVVTAAGSVASCAAAPPCPGARVCGNANWYVTASGTPIEGRVAIAPLTAVAGAASEGTEAMTVSERAVYLRFDLRDIGDGTIDRAVISLAPHPSWQPSGPTRIVARAVGSEWSAATVAATAPVLNPDIVGEVVVPGATRVPVRIDVTAALRGLNENTPFDGVALFAYGAPVTFAGLAIDTATSRPRLEMVIR